MSVTGAIVIITGWFALMEFDSYPESERNRILQKIKKSPALILLIALMPVGLGIHVLGAFAGQLWMVLLGATLIFIQGVIVSLLFWQSKRWKSIILLIAMIVLGGLLYVPLLIR